MLTQENLDKLRTLLTQAIDQHLADGGKLVAHKFYDGVDNKEYCPVSCLIGIHPTTGDRSYDIAAKLDTRFSTTDLWNLVDGFDQTIVSEQSKNSDLYKLGQELRAKYLPIVSNNPLVNP
jgi:hypothetical protein